MDCLPYDPSMNDNADQASTTSQEFNSHEKEDDDHITVPFARVGKLLSNDPQPTTTQTQPTTTSTQPTSSQPTYQMGDVNGDGDLDVADATLLQKFLNFRPVTIHEEVADVSGNGRIDVRDVTAIQKKVAG